MELNSELDRLRRYSPIEKELQRSKTLHPQQNDINIQALIMLEEAGEVAKGVLKYQFEKGRLQNIKDELIQTAAMCMKMLENLPETMITWEHSRNESFKTINGEFQISELGEPFDKIKELYGAEAPDIWYREKHT